MQIAQILQLRVAPRATPGATPRATPKMMYYSPYITQTAVRLQVKEHDMMKLMGEGLRDGEIFFAITVTLLFVIKDLGS